MKIGVIGTSATINSHSYKLRLEKLNPNFKVYEQDCPLFVPLVENGFICRDDQIVRLVVKNSSLVKCSMALICRC